jgi:very-short-patch-repair endonuclease
MANELARALRRKMTDAEMRLWFRLRPLRRQGLAFRRQSPVGRFILDFECRPAKLGIELDGGQHGEAANRARDAERTLWLEFRGYEILRFWNDTVIFETDAVMDHIILTAQRRLAMLEPR